MKSLIHRLPLDRLSMNGNMTTPPQHFLASAAFPLPGPMEVVEGYELIDTAKIMTEIGRTGAPAANALEDMRQWVEDWNTNIEWDCAVSHLTKAIATVFEVALSTAESMSLFQIGQISSGNVTGLLSDILGRLDKGSNRAMDDVFSTSATRNLGDAVLILANYSSTSRVGDRSLNANSLMQVACEVSKSVESSAMGSDATSDSVLRNERTVCLGSALSLLIQRAAAIDHSVMLGYKDEFIGAAQSLAPISCVKVDSGESNSLQTASIMARNCVGTMVDMFNEEEDVGVAHPFVSSAFSLPWMESLLRLVAELDANVCCLLQHVSLQPSGATLLISAGVGEALSAAATTYSQKEGSRLTTLQVGTRIDLFAPSFLTGHLKLMSALLAAKNLPEQIFLRFLETCINILGIYKPILVSLCGNFPRQADSLREFLKCLALIVSVTNPISSDAMNEAISSQQQQLRSVLSNQQFLETGGLSALIAQIWEEPLPKDMQRSVQLPRELTEPPGTKRYETTTWWDNLEVMLAARQNDESHSSFSFDAPSSQVSTAWASSSINQKKWNETKYEYCIVALRVLCVGASIMRRLNRLDLVDASSLARGICRCSHAAKMIHQRLQDVKRAGGLALQSPHSDEQRETMLEYQYLSLLASTLAESVEQEVLLAAMLTSGGSASKENLSGTSSAESTLASAISVSGLQQHPKFFSDLPDDAARTELLSYLSKDIVEGWK